MKIQNEKQKNLFRLPFLSLRGLLLFHDQYFIASQIDFNFNCEIPLHLNSLLEVNQAYISLVVLDKSGEKILSDDEPLNLFCRINLEIKYYLMMNR